MCRLVKFPRPRDRERERERMIRTYRPSNQDHRILIKTIALSTCPSPKQTICNPSHENGPKYIFSFLSRHHPTREPLHYDL